MIGILITLVNIFTQALVFLILISVLLTYILPPYHSIRRTIDKLIEPMLSQIRRIVPTVGMLDLSPLILIILVQLISYALNHLLAALR